MIWSWSLLSDRDIAASENVPVDSFRVRYDQETLITPFCLRRIEK